MSLTRARTAERDLPRSGSAVLIDALHTHVHSARGRRRIRPEAPHCRRKVFILDRAVQTGRCACARAGAADDRCFQHGNNVEADASARSQRPEASNLF
ncbi:hypothetical protein EVAR_19561_1 [Eumeta japonica]|uniref:Uncharacterized protein n=1 Tax=Eumeta variegata TaxID=151549 RepID=A0A4C1UF68_EUMVA|nr:hypothetical protein EVAR_19561_1 [Eumeta japonica]